MQAEAQSWGAVRAKPARYLSDSFNASAGKNPAKTRPKSGHRAIITVRKPLYFNENPAKTRPQRGEGGSDSQNLVI